MRRIRSENSVDRMERMFITIKNRLDTLENVVKAISASVSLYEFSVPSLAVQKAVFYLGIYRIT